MSNSSSLTASIQESVEYQRETQWRRDGVPEVLIRLSRQSGMDAADMQVFEAMSRRGWLIISRCPKPEARAWHGTFGPKTGATTSVNSGTSGLVVTASRIMVSDYDLMSVWQRSGAQWQKLFIAPEGGAKRGPLTPQAVLPVEAEYPPKGDGRREIRHSASPFRGSPLRWITSE